MYRKVDRSTKDERKSWFLSQLQVRYYILEFYLKSLRILNSCQRKSAVIKDIRIVLPIKISAIDNTEKDELSKDLESKKYKIRDCQEAVALSTMSLNLLKKQLQRAKEDYDLLDP